MLRDLFRGSKVLANPAILFFALVALAGCGGADNAPTDTQTRVDAPAEMSSVSTDVAGPAEDSMPPGADLGYTLVMLGDSITAGYGLDADQALPFRLQDALRDAGLAVTIVNAGVSGDTTADGLSRFDWSVTPEAEGLIVALGGNDLLQGIDPATTRRNLGAIIDKAKARGLDILIAQIKAPGNYGAEYQTAFNTAFSEIARDADVALFDDYLGPAATDRSLMQDDNIHPNQAGVAAMVDNIVPVIRKTFPLEEAADE